MRAAWVLALTAVACAQGEARLDATARDAPDASEVSADAGVLELGVAEAGAPDQGVPDLSFVDVGVDAGPPPRLVVAFEPGQLVVWPAESGTLAVGRAQVLQVGEPILAVARQPGPPTDRRYAVVTRREGSGSVVRLVTLSSAGEFIATATVALGAGAVGPIRFDGAGQRLFAASDEGLVIAPVSADGLVGTPATTRGCRPGGILEHDGVVWTSCPPRNELTREGRTFSLGATPIAPLGLERLGDRVLVHGTRLNGVEGSVNRVLTVADDGALGAPVPLVLPAAEPAAAPFATALAVHPTLPVAYAVQGGAFAYGGNHVAVVRRDAPGALSVVQYEPLVYSNSSDARCAAVSSDGAWLLVGTRSVREVRGWPIDPRDGRLGASTVVVLADAPVFVELGP